ncbi:MAG: GNAT family N-acetyltransferase, partial [Eubacteriaceae bacterium]|nr:GNAT family N-acetyltransferase [Eubacteriaceae bacterium]
LVRLSGMIRSSDAWAVTLKGDNAAVGWIRFRPDELRRRPKCLQVGYGIRSDLRRNGYMKEALEEAMNYVFRSAGAQIVSARVFPDNAASIKLLIGNGFSLSGRLPEYYSPGPGAESEDVLLFSRRRSDSAGKRDDPSLMARQLASLCDPSEGWLTCLSNAVAFIYDGMEMVNWSGIYFLKNDRLYLGPFNGKPACSVLELTRGVCAKSARERKTVVVDDVHLFEGHIACDSASASEIVIPLILDGELLGVLDIDSPIRERFGETERRMLEEAAGVITGLLREYKEEKDRDESI